MKTRLFLSLLSPAIIAAAGSAACADVFWNEAVQGDLSNSGLSPTAFTLGAGTHSLLATTGGGDLDYLSIELAPGTQLSQIILVSYKGLDEVAFVAIQSGAAFTEPPGAPNPANLLGWAHFGPGAGNLGTDILDDIGQGFGAIGFTPPLPEATYSFWLQQLTIPVSYRLDFIIEGPAVCYANCDGSTTAPVLNVNDFVCFQQRFAAGDSYANCDGSTTPPILNVNDFVCFQQQFAAGCP